MRGRAERRAAESGHCVRHANKPTTEALKGGCVQRAGARWAGEPHKGVLFGKAGAAHRGADRRPFILQPGLGLKTLFLKWDGAPGPVSSSAPLPGGPVGAGGPGVSRYLGCRWPDRPWEKRDRNCTKGRPWEKPVLTSPARGPQRGAPLEPACFCHQKLGGKNEGGRTCLLPHPVSCRVMKSESEARSCGPSEPEDVVTKPKTQNKTRPGR